MDSEIQLRLSVWRPAALRKQYLYAPNGDLTTKDLSSLSGAIVLEAVYSWDAGPHDLFSGCTSEFGSVLRDALLEPFSSGHPPASRGVARFGDAIDELLHDPRLASDTRWSDLQEQAGPGPAEDYETNLRANITLATLRHFAWVGQTFRHVPYACVLLR